MLWLILKCCFWEASGNPNCSMSCVPATIVPLQWDPRLSTLVDLVSVPDLSNQTKGIVKYKKQARWPDYYILFDTDADYQNKVSFDRILGSDGSKGAEPHWNYYMNMVCRKLQSNLVHGNGRIIPVCLPLPQFFKFPLQKWVFFPVVLLWHWFANTWVYHLPACP